MTPAARAQAAIELLDQIIGATRRGEAAADTIVTRYFRARRYAGSADRRAVRELVFRAIRRAGEVPASGRAALVGLAREDPSVATLFDGSERGPSALAAEEAGAPAGIAPHWLLERLDPLVGAAEWRALIGRAPLELRVNRIRGTREQALSRLPDASPTPYSSIGLRLPEGTRVEREEIRESGWVEVQGEASQLVCLGCEARPGDRVVDLCAGAGGKTLALGAEMANRGMILACDTARDRLSRLKPRVDRAGVEIVESRLLDPGRESEALADWSTSADLVLVDAPCSGSGTWRRNPETRWRMTPDRLDRLTTLQSRLLDVATELVRPGGHLVYAVCSMLREEGRDQAEMLSRRSSLVPVKPAIPAGREAGPGLLLTPAHDGTDGFFVARWQRPC